MKLKKNIILGQNKRRENQVHLLNLKNRIPLPRQWLHQIKKHENKTINPLSRLMFKSQRKFKNPNPILILRMKSKK
jgi:hypothetical protein